MAEDRTIERDELQRVLDTYGADQRRWPTSARTRFAPLLEDDAASRRLLAETRALGRILDRAPVPAVDRTSALADRIMAAASAGDRASSAMQGAATPARAQPARVVPFRNRPGPVKSNDEPMTARTAWQAGALIAACLLAGIYLGAGTSVLPVMQDVAESVGIVADIDGSAGLFGLGDVGDEDSL